MDFKKIENRNICILGWGIENQALVKFLLKNKIDCQITVCDARKSVGTSRGLSSVQRKLGKNYDKNLNAYDIIFRSPGYPLFEKNIIQAKKSGVEISSPMELFFNFCPTKNIIGVTGTKGKGTTSSLIFEILKLGGKKIFLGGNIGVAPFTFIDKIKKNDWVVLELSSFQLEDLNINPKIVVITNFYKEHLAPADPNNPNFHKSFKKYWEAKVNIFKRQEKGNILIVNKKLKNKIKKLKLRNKTIYFNKSELPSKLVGEYNKENIAASVEAAKIIGVKENIIKKAIANFKGLEHRLELVKKVKGVEYYDDSFATTPEATILALKSFSSPIVALLGGADKGSDFSKLTKIVKQKVKFVVLLKGQATLKIQNLLIKDGYSKEEMKIVSNIKEAMRQVGRKIVNGDIVLLSTACASFGMFKNYKERGNLFKQEVKKLKK